MYKIHTRWLALFEFFVKGCLLMHEPQNRHISRASILQMSVLQTRDYAVCKFASDVLHIYVLKLAIDIK